MPLNNKSVIVTGAAKGIGRAIVESCLAAGAEVWAIDCNKEALQELNQNLDIEALKTEVLDITDEAAVKELMSHVFSSNDIWGLVNNAGIYKGKKLANYTVEEMRLVLEVNVMGAMLLSQQFAQHKKNRAGVIVNLSSVSGQDHSSDTVYGVSKAALLGLTKSCAVDFSPYLRVNAVCPGVVLTDMMKDIPTEKLAEYRKNELLDEVVTAEDVANTVEFLLSNAGAHYTGATFDLNNGGYRR